MTHFLNTTMVGDISLKKFLIFLFIFLAFWVLMKMGDAASGEDIV